MPIFAIRNFNSLKECFCTCVKALAFQAPNKSPFEAQYKHQSLLFEIWLNKLLLGKKLPKLQIKCYEVGWGGKITATQPSTISLSVKRSKEYSFTLFHHVFWKRTIFEGVPVLVVLVFLVPKVHWGVKKMKKKKFLKGKPIWPFPFNFCEPTLSDLLSQNQTFSNPATRWRCPAPDSCNSLLISSLKICSSICMSKTRQLNQSWFVLGSINTLK